MAVCVPSGSCSLLDRRHVADHEVGEVDPDRIERVHLLRRTARTAFVRRVGEDRQSGGDVGPADRAVDLALVRPHLERRADFAECAPPPVGRILHQLLVQRVLAHLDHRHRVEREPGVLEVPACANDVDIAPVGHGLQIIERLLRPPPACRIDQTGHAVGARRVHLEQDRLRVAAQVLMDQRRPVGQPFGIHVSPQRADDGPARETGRVGAGEPHQLLRAGVGAPAGRQSQPCSGAQHAERFAAREPSVRYSSSRGHGSRPRA